MRVGIFGFGFVGQALAHRLKSHEIAIYDPPKNHCKIPEDIDVAFVCVPTPTVNSLQDYSYIHDALKVCSAPVVFMKSTVLPGCCDTWSLEYDKTIVACPEFLSRATAHKDIYSQAIIVGDSGYEFARDLFKGQEIITMTNTEAELVKYTHNTFGALKVTYFNMIYEACKKLGSDYEKVKSGVLNSSGYINPQHTEVPGSDGKFGFGGPCLPKDSSAFVTHLRHLSTTGSIALKDLLKANKVFRGECESD